jgi:prevent-host-death family protein
MDSKTTLSITDARKDIFKITADVQKPGVIYTLTEKGRPKAVIMSAEEFESWAETLEVMHDFPNLARELTQAEIELKQGKTISLEDYLLSEGYTLTNNQSLENVSHRNKTKGSQKFKKTKSKR